MTFFSHKKIGATLYQSKPVISSTPSLNVDRNCRFFIQPVGRASSLSCKTINDESLPTGWMKLKIAARPAGWPTWRRSSPWSSWSPSCCSSSVSSSQPSRQGAQSAVRTRMRRKRTLKMWYLTENGDNFDRFLNFHKKLSIGDIFSHKNWCHLPLNSHESTKISIKKSPKSVTIYSLKMSPKLVKNKSPKKVKSLVNQQHFYKKITKIGDNLLTGNVTKIGEKSFTKKSENFSESVKFSTKKSPKLVTFYSMKISPKLVTNSSPKKVKILVNH